MITAAVAGLFVAFSVSVFALIIGDYRLVTSLRRRHRAVWERLGGPSPWFSRLEDVSAVHRFLHERAYTALDDPALVRACDRLRVLTLVTCVLAVAALAVATIARRIG